MNRGFGWTLLAIVVALELLLRVAPDLSPRVFRGLYGNSLSVYMELTERLGERAPRVRFLGLGDSLAMTQFQPASFAAAMGVDEDAVFNAAYLGMSFPSQDRMIRHVGLESMPELELVLLFLNPRRLSAEEVPNTDVFRVGVPEPDGPWRDVTRTWRVTPLLDHSRLYGLSRYLVLEGWRALISPDSPSWDQLEYLRPAGGSSWSGRREPATPPDYPYPALREIGNDRLAELESLIGTFRRRGVPVVIVPSAVHPSVDVFASEDARARYERAVSKLATRTGAVLVGEATELSASIADADFCDYGHTNARGGDAYTKGVAGYRRALLQGG